MAQLEVDCFWNELVSHEAEGEWAKMAKFRTLSMDIECAGRKGHFPDAKHDPVIQARERQPSLLSHLLRRVPPTLGCILCLSWLAAMGLVALISLQKATAARWLTLADVAC